VTANLDWTREGLTKEILGLDPARGAEQAKTRRCMSIGYFDVPKFYFCRYRNSTFFMCLVLDKMN
jgi:hypothetical protein